MKPFLNNQFSNQSKILILVLLLMFANIWSNKIYSATITTSCSGNWSGATTNPWPNSTRTGTITTTTSSTSLTGSGTLFLTELSVGSIVKTTGDVVIGTIASVTDNTHATFTGNAASNQTDQSYHFSGSPGKGDDVVISSSYTVTLDVAAQCNNFTLNSNGPTLTMGAYNLTVYGNLQLNQNNQGTITASGGGYIIMDGSVNSAQSILAGGSNATMTIPNIRLQNNANVTNGSNSNNGLTVTNFDCSSGTSTFTNACTSYNGKPLTVNGTLTAPNCSFLITNSNVATAYDFSNTTSNPATIGSFTLNQSGNTATFGSKNIAIYSGLTYSAGTLTTSGTISLYGTTLDIGAALSLTNFTIQNASISKTGAGTLTITGTYDRNCLAAPTISAGAITASGSTINSGCSVNYYSKSTGNLDALSNWGTNTDGSGSNPSNFTTAGAVYNIRNNATPTLGAAWTVSGTGAKIIVGDGTNACNFTIPSSYALSTPSIDVVNNGTLTIANTTIPSIGTLATGSTVIYSGVGQTVASMNYYNLALSGSGTKTLQSGTTTISGNLSLSGTATATTVADLTISGTLTIGDGTTFTSAGYALTVSGTTTVGGGTSGSLVISSSTGTKTFTGLVTISSGATWNNSGNSAISFAGGITNNGTFTAGSGVQTFQTNSQGLTGTISIPSITVTGVTLTNNGTLSITTALAGTGGLTNAATGTLNIGFTGTVGITTLTASSSGNTVNYNYNGSQTVRVITYHHLSLSTGGTKTFAVTTINGNLTIASGVTTTISANSSVGGNISNAGTCTIACGTLVTITGNFTNTGTFNGAGSGGISKITVAGSSWNNNSGTICNDGSLLDFCHASTSSDHLSGTVGSNVSYCTYSATCIGITIASASQVSAGNVVQNATKNALSAFTIADANSDATLNQIVFSTTNTAADIAKYQLWYNSSNSLGSATQIGSDITTSLGTGSHTFGSLTQVITAGTTGYFWITADIQSNATVSNTITVSAISSSSISIAAGSKTGSITAGGTQTIILAVPAVALASSTQTTASTIGRSWTNKDIATFSLATTIASTTLTQIDFTTTGSIVNGDLTNMKLWYNTSNTLNGATQIGSTISSSMGAGSHSFTSLSHTLTMGTTEYYWITIDVGASATNAATIGISAFTTSNFTISSGNKSGSTTASGTQTVASSVTYYSRVNGGNWNSAATWSTISCGNASPAGAYPTSVDIVNICNGYNVNLTADQSCTDITIASGATLADGGYTLTVGGNITNNGTYSGTGKMLLSGGHAEHQITSTNDNSLYKIELNDSWGAIISNSAASIKTTTLTYLTLTSGIFRIGDFNNASVYNKFTLTNNLTVSNGAGFKLGGDCTGNLTFNGTVTIANGGSWTGTAGKTCSSVTMNGAFTNNSAAQTDNSSSTYIIPNTSMIMNAGSGMNIYNLTSQGVNSTFSGTWSVRNALNTAQFKLNANAVLYLYGLVTASSSNDWVQCSSTSTVHFATNGMTLLAQQYVCIVQIDNGVTVNLPSGTFQPRTNLILDDNSTINVTSSGAIDYQCGYTLHTGSKIYINNGTTPNNFNSYTSTYDPGSSFEFGNNGGSYSLTIDPSKHPFGNFLMDNASSASTITLINSNATAAGSLTIGSNVTLTTNGSTRNISIGGDFTNNGTLDVSTNRIGTITFNGSSSQTISGSTTTTFNGLTINNTSSAGVTLSKPITVNGTLTLTDGIVYSTTTNLLTMASGSSASSGSDASHVDGPMKKIGNTAFTFPIGKSAVWARLGFTPSSGFDATTEISSEYYYSGATNPNNLGAGIHNVSKIEYWDITRVTDPSNDASCNVTLYVNSKTRSGVSGTGTDVTTAHYESGAWTNKGGTFHDNGDGTGYITSTTPLTSYSPEDLASTNGGSSLPIELTDFTVKAQENHGLISWTTASETNNSFFTLERSIDGTNWESIYTCKGAGTSTQKHHYNYYDAEELEGVVYYRIQQTDFDETTTVSEIKSIQISINGIVFTTYPNPSRIEDMMIYIKTETPEIVDIAISNSLGVIVSEGKIELTDKQRTIKLSEIIKLNQGTYNITIKTKNFDLNRKIIIL